MSISLSTVKKPLFQSAQKLPIGFFCDGKRFDSFNLSPYTSEHDLAIIRLKQRCDGDLHQLCSQLFPLILTDFNGVPLRDLANKLDLTIEELIAELPAADALTIIANIRYLEIGEDMYFQGTCPYCGTNNDDDPKKGLSHKLGGIDVGFSAGLKSEPIYTANLSTGIGVDIYPLQFCQFKQFCNSDVPLDLRQVFFSAVASSDDSFDRNRDGMMDEAKFLQLVTNIDDRNLLIRAVDPFYQLGPTIEIGTDCKKCKQEWELDMPISAMEDFFYNLFFTPTEEDLDNIFFYMAFGEQAPCKSIAEAKQLPIRERDRLVSKIADAYKRQQDDAKKSSKGGKNKTTEYV
jgi:hypothetical protein